MIYPADFNANHANADELVRAAESLIPQLRERAKETEALRRLPEETCRDIRERGLSRLFQPKRFGGAEASIDRLIDVMIPIASGCPSTAWCLAQYIFHNFMIARWPAEAQEEIWKDSSCFVSGILIPRMGRARRTRGGYVLSGEWPFVSGVEPSQWCLLTGMVEQDKAPDEERYFLVPTSQVTIVDTWRPIGLHGSGSQDVRADDLAVPEHMTVSIESLRGGDHPGSLLNPAPLFRLPVYMTCGISLASALIGMAEAMFENFLMQSRNRQAYMTNAETAGFPTHQMRVGEVSASLQAAEMLVRADCREMTENAEADIAPSPIDRSSYRCNSAYAGRLARKAAECVWDLIGARGAYETNTIARLYGDIAVASRHTAMNWEVNATEHGRARLRFPLSNSSL